MKVMVVVKATKHSEAGEMPAQDLLMEMGKFNEELVKAGVMKAGEGLKPSSQAKRVHFRGNERIVTDGPFAETKELIAGYWIWEVASMEEAIDWVKRCPNPMPNDSDIDIRPIYEIDDFIESDPTHDIRNHEEDLIHQMSLQSATVSPYLFFSGRCEEALSFYEIALGAKTTMKMRFNESPEPVPPGMLQSGFESKIMHASFKIGAMTLMASDGCDDKSRFDGLRLALTLSSNESCEKCFHALADGGTIDMPLVKTFWSPLYGMVTDKFGLGWMVMVASQNS